MRYFDPTLSFYDNLSRLEQKKPCIIQKSINFKSEYKNNITHIFITHNDLSLYYIRGLFINYNDSTLYMN